MGSLEQGRSHFKKNMRQYEVISEILDMFSFTELDYLNILKLKWICKIYPCSERKENFCCGIIAKFVKNLINFAKKVSVPKFIII